MTKAIFAGQWTSTYSYHDGKDSYQHIVTFEEGANLIGRSLPQSDGSKLILQLQHDTKTNTITGTWQETTSLSGPYAGSIFHGALQLILNTTGDMAEGKWVGYNSMLTRVNAGNWMLEKRQP